MERLDLAPTDEQLDVEISLEQLHRELGEQGILAEDEDRPEFFYLAALSLECYEDDDYSATDVVIEFIRNSREFEHLSVEDCDEVEALLR